MAVDQVYELVPDPISINAKGERTRQRAFLVTFDADGGTELDARVAIGINRYDAHPDDAGCLAQEVSSGADGGTFGAFGVCRVVYAYQSMPSEQGAIQEQAGGSSDEQDIELLVPQITFKPVHYSVPLGPKDAAGVDVVNYAGSYPENPPEVERSDLAFTITTWQPITFDAIAAALTYQDSVNNAVWAPFTFFPNFTWPQYSLRCTEYAFTPEIRKGAAVWKLDVTIQYRYAKWHPVKWANVGTMQVNSADPAGPLVPCIGPTGEPVTSAVPLDGDGYQADAGTPLVILENQGYALTDFSGILG